jgi:hypothetical protein
MPPITSWICKAERDAPEWQAAMEALILVAETGPALLARIGAMRALNRHVDGLQSGSQGASSGQAEAQAESVIAWRHRL